MRVILFTGKGGVGKTSIAAATAIYAADRGLRTIILSTDVAHSLGDSLDYQLGNEPREVIKNLWGQETKTTTAIEEHWQTIQGYFASVLAWQGVDAITAEEMAILPGMDELANLLYINRFERDNKYDLAVIDCAPTGETLRLLSFPEMLNWWMKRMFPLGKKMVTIAKPFAGALHVPLPGNEVMESVQLLYEELDHVRKLLTDVDTTSVRLVVNPEKMVIKEAERSLTYLNLYGYHTDLVVCNRLIPGQAGGEYFRGWKDSQKKYLKMIKDDFSPLPVFTVPLFDQEVVGAAMLKRMGAELYNGQDPAQVFYKGKIQEVTKEGTRYVLNLSLPFTSREKIELAQNGDELTIEIGGFRRNVILPRVLVGKTAGQARFEGEKLRITFEDDKRNGK
jgi:arsenite/tail-anchored protein-transporting ATPase